jgi:serine/threonine protein kinase
MISFSLPIQYNRPSHIPFSPPQTYIHYMNTITDSSIILPNGNDPVPLGSGVVAGILGAGGMAQVYKIWCERLEVFRAVKILYPNCTADLKQRFETETKITAKLHHPNIVEIYTVGEWNGLPFIEMEFIDGEPLEAIIGRHRRVPPAVCAAIGLQVADALAYAHGQEFLLYGKTYHGVIHRDLKPSNIMIDKKGRVRLMDFGIARPAEASLHTVDGVGEKIVGTMQYLAPEQIEGVGIDCRSDLYALGAVLYEILTGERTFPQDAITTLMKKKITGEYRKIADFGFTVSPALAKVVTKCLQLVKEERYATAEELKSDIMAAQPTDENPASVIDRFLRNPSEPVSVPFVRKPESRKLSRRTLTIGIVVAAVWIAAMALFAIRFMKPAAPHQTTATITTAKPVAATVSDVKSAPQAPPPRVDSLRDTSHKAGAVPPSVSTVPVSHLVTTPQPEPARIKPAIPFSTLEKKYHSGDPVTIARNALKAGKPVDAIAAIENVPAGITIDPLKRRLLLLEAAIDAGRAIDALTLSGGSDPGDGQFDLLRGRLSLLRERDEEALGFLTSAKGNSSVLRKRNELRDDAAYYSAIARSAILKKDPSDENRKLAREAWVVVKKLYASYTTLPRYAKAVKEIAEIDKR